MNWKAYWAFLASLGLLLLFAGCAVGMFVTALCTVSRNANLDAENEALLRDNREKTLSLNTCRMMLDTVTKNREAKK